VESTSGGGAAPGSVSGHRPGVGLGLAVVSAATFGTAGTLATSLLDSGWSPAAAVTARVVIAALALTIPALSVMCGQWGRVAAASRTMVIYGLVAVAGAQLCYFNAVEHVSVGIALLLEYLATVLIVGWQWARHGRRPRRLTIAGIVVVIVGLALVLDLRGGQHVELIGVVWGLGAAVGLATFYVLSAATVDDGLPPIAMAWVGMAVGGVALAILGFAHVIAFHANTNDVQFLHHRMSWLVPVLGLALLAAALAYACGITAARILGAKLASFVGLSEVLFAALFAWLFVNQHLHRLQIAGGILVLIGIAVVRADERAPVLDVEPVGSPAPVRPAARSLS
jgi:drug/metabolite transporter (DMT)-like permease